MMKRLRKPAALLLALVMALTLTACGGGKGSSKTNPAVGKYIGETVLSFDECGQVVLTQSVILLSGLSPSSVGS